MRETSRVELKHVAMGRTIRRYRNDAIRADFESDLEERQIYSERRKDKTIGLTQAELAALFDYTNAESISRLENGKGTKGTFERLARVLKRDGDFERDWRVEYEMLVSTLSAPHPNPSEPGNAANLPKLAEPTGGSRTAASIPRQVNPRAKYLLIPFLATVGLVAFAGWWLTGRSQPSSRKLTVSRSPVLTAYTPIYEYGQIKAAIEEITLSFAAEKVPNSAAVSLLQDASSANLVRVDPVPLQHKAAYVQCSPSEPRLLTVGHDGAVRIWSEPGWNLQRTLGGSSFKVHRAWFDDDGRAITATNGWTVRVWKVGSWTNVIDAPGRRLNVRAARYYRGKLRVAYQRPDRLIIWDSQRRTDTVLEGQYGGATAVDFMLRGNIVTVASGDRSIRYYGTDPIDGRKSVDSINTFSLHQAPIVSLVAHEAGAVSADESGAVYVRAENGKRPLQEFQLPSPIVDSALDGPGSLVATVCRNGTVEIRPSLKLKDGPLWNLPATVRARSASISVDRSKLYLVTTDGRLDKWLMPMPFMVGHFGKVHHAQFSPRGFLVTASSDNGVLMWRKSGGNFLAKLSGDRQVGHEGGVFHCAFSPNGDSLVTTGGAPDTSVILWKPNYIDGKPHALPASKNEYSVFRGHTSRVNYAAFSRDGHRFATAAADGTVAIWDRGSGEWQTWQAHSGEARAASFHPDGQPTLTAGRDGKVLLWSPPYTSPVEIGRFGRVWSAAWNPSGDRIVVAVSGQPARVIDHSGKSILKLESGGGESRWAVYSPDGTSIATADGDLRVRLWHSKSGQERMSYAGHNDTVWTVEYSADGQHIVTASSDGTARVYPATLERLAKDWDSCLTAVARMAVNAKRIRER